MLIKYDIPFVGWLLHIMSCFQSIISRGDMDLPVVRTVAWGVVGLYCGWIPWCNHCRTETETKSSWERPTTKEPFTLLSHCMYIYNLPHWWKFPSELHILVFYRIIKKNHLSHYTLYAKLPFILKLICIHFIFFSLNSKETNINLVYLSILLSLKKPESRT